MHIAMAMSSQLRGKAQGLWKIVPFIIVLLLWELLARSGIYNAKLFPAPTTIVRAFREMIAAGDFVRDLLMSVGRAFVGFASGALLGVVSGCSRGGAALGGFSSIQFCSRYDRFHQSVSSLLLSFSSGWMRRRSTSWYSGVSFFLFG